MEAVCLPPSGGATSKPPGGRRSFFAKTLACIDFAKYTLRIAGFGFPTPCFVLTWSFYAPPPMVCRSVGHRRFFRWRQLGSGTGKSRPRSVLWPAATSDGADAGRHRQACDAERGAVGATGKGPATSRSPGPRRPERRHRSHGASWSRRANRTDRCARSRGLDRSSRASWQHRPQRSSRARGRAGAARRRWPARTDRASRFRRTGSDRGGGSPGCDWSARPRGRDGTYRRDRFRWSARADRSDGPARPRGRDGTYRRDGFRGSARADRSDRSARSGGRDRC